MYYFVNKLIMILPGMAEGRMAQIMREANRLGEHFIEPERACDRPADLCDFQGVRQARSVKIALVIYEDLRLINESAEGRRMNNPVAVSLKLPTIGRFRLIVSAPEALFLVCRVGF